MEEYEEQERGFTGLQQLRVVASCRSRRPTSVGRGLGCQKKTPVAEAPDGMSAAAGVVGDLWLVLRASLPPFRRRKPATSLSRRPRLHAVA
jgi:hypothetical protein